MLTSKFNYETRELKYNFPDNLIKLLCIYYEIMYLYSYRLNIQQKNPEILSRVGKLRG